jgi:hypothetical protein
MDVKKIFIILIGVVAVVILGAFVLNILMPNVTEQLVDATEDLVFSATGLEFDFNANGSSGAEAARGEAYTEGEDGSRDTTIAGVDGFAEEGAPTTS